jgi:hypothetical protein
MRRPFLQVPFFPQQLLKEGASLFQVLGIELKTRGESTPQKRRLSSAAERLHPDATSWRSDAYTPNVV